MADQGVSIDRGLSKPAQERKGAAAGAGLRRLALVLVGALVLCWAAVVNGGPFFHPDTQSYIRGPDVAVMKLLGPQFASPWATHDPGRAAPAAPGAKAVRPGGHSYDDGQVLAGRSIYYGALAWLGEITSGFWLTIFVQALAVAGVIEILLRTSGHRRAWTYVAAVGGVAFATPAPMFVALLMPDIWAAVGLASFGVLIAFGSRLRRWEALLLTVLLAFGVLAHTSNLLLLAVLLGVALVLRWSMGAASPRIRLGMAAGATALATGLIGGWLFTFAVTHVAGAAPINPPFITARLVADGTGARFLESHCPAARFEACRYRAQRPQDADDFLWSLDPHKAVFATASPASRKALSQEQVRLALAVVAANPLAQVAASARNVLVQIGDSDLMNFNYKAGVRASLDAAVPAHRLGMFQRTLAYRELWPLGAMQAWFNMVRFAAIVVIAGGLGALWRRRRDLEPAASGLGVFAVMIVAGVLANAAICGALSSPYGRYQARLDWLLPLTALLLVANLQVSSKRKPA